MTRSPSHTKLRRETLARLGAAMLALLFVMAQAVSLADRVMVEHAICPEHGEWIHVHGNGSPPPRLSLELHPGHSPRPLLRGLATAPAPDEHDVCALPALQEPHEGAPLRGALVLGLPREQALLHARHARAAMPLPLLSLAPKSSPPLAA